MPRTDFLAMYKSVKDKFKGKDLYELVRYYSAIQMRKVGALGE